MNLVFKSLRNRKLTSSVTVLTIALSVALLIGVEQVRKSARESFQGVISGTDLIVGPRSGPTQLLLYAVFHMGTPTSNISYESYLKFKEHPSVEWTIPVSLGDSHRGFRVVGTDENFYRHYRFRQGRSLEFAEGSPSAGVFDVVIGSEVAASLGYDIGSKIVVTHGISNVAGIMDHDDKPFTVTGILERTATPVDRSVYITLAGMEAVHIDWQEGAPPMPGEEVPASEIRAEDLHVEQITAFLLRNKSRIETLRLQREVNTYEGEPLMAVIPGVTLSEFWRGISYAEDGLRVVSVFVVIVGLLGMLMSIYTSLNERRREMAILRAVGARPREILTLMVLESSFLSLAGVFFGVLLVYALLFSFQPVIEDRFGLFIPVGMLSLAEMLYLAGVVVAGTLVGLLPAYKAYRNTLADGLTIRV